MVLCAGMGSRLGALSDERPKPLLPVCDLPLVRYNLALLAGAGIREAAVNLHHRGELLRAELGEAAEGVALTWSEEETLLGTGGGLRRMADWLTRGGREPFLVVNGKLILDVDLQAVLSRHREAEAEATMVVREVPDAERWGAIGVDESGLVRTILGRTGREEAAHAAAQQESLLQRSKAGDPVTGARADPAAGAGLLRQTMFTGVHVVGPRLVERLPGGVSCVIRQGYLPLLGGGGRVAAFLYDGYFQEHSTPERYLEGNRALLRGEARLRHPPGPLTGVDPAARIDRSAALIDPVRVGPGAVVEAGATVGPEAVVGRGTRVLPGATLARAVAWPDSVVEGRVERAIVTPRGVFPV